MTRKILHGLLLAGVLAASGCSASLNATGTVAGTGTGGTSGGGAAGALANVYKVGKSYTYNMSNSVSPQANGTITWEVTDVSNGKATIKTSMNMMGASNSSTFTVDLNGQNPYANMSTGAPGGTASNGQATVTTSQESVTVPAGTFNCTKIHSVNGSAVSDTWYDTTVGLVKSVSTNSGVSTTLELASHT